MPPLLVFDLPPTALDAQRRSCSGIRLSWVAPENPSHLSAVTGYLVAYQNTQDVPEDLSEGASWLPSGAAFESEDASAVALMPPHRLIMGHATVELDGLHASTEYAASVLPRNKYGWGRKWSEPIYFDTAADTLSPLTPGSVAVHPTDKRCSEIAVRVPRAPYGICRRPAEFAVQIRVGHSLDDGTASWVTVRRAIATPQGEAVRIKVTDPTRPFQVRLTAQNDQGVADPSEPTTVAPADQGSGGCLSEFDWDPLVSQTSGASGADRSRVVVTTSKASILRNRVPSGPTIGVNGSLGRAELLAGIAAIMAVGVTLRGIISRQRYSKVASSADRDDSGEEEDEVTDGSEESDDGEETTHFTRDEFGEAPARSAPLNDEEEAMLLARVASMLSKPAPTLNGTLTTPPCTAPTPAPLPVFSL